MNRPIYLDHNATTPLDPHVFEAMKPFFLEKFGNPSSDSHLYGWEAHEAVELARETIAKLIGTNAKSIIFTSGATESNNLALKGMIWGLPGGSQKKSVHLITQKTEHKSILEVFQELQREGHEVTYLNVDSYGLIDPDDLKKSIKKNTFLCSIMVANNEIGTIQPIKEIASICKEHQIYFHTDAAQAVGKIPLNVLELGIDLMSFSGHKIYAPKGIGVLYIAPSIHPSQIKPLLHGADHERRLRSGTLNVAGIIGLAKALEICSQEMEKESKRQIELRDFFIQEIQKQLKGVSLNGHPQKRIPNNIHLSIEGVKNDALLLAVPQLAFSTGSACSSEFSHVIQAIQKEKKQLDSTIRLGLGHGTTKKDMEFSLKIIVDAVKKIREQSPKLGK